MKSILLSPEQETLPNRYRWTVDDCDQMVTLGILKGRYEVLDGEVVIKMSQKPPHRIAVILIVDWLTSLFGGRCVQSEGPIALTVPDGSYSEPDPDIAVTREPTTVYSDRHPGPADLLFVAEVSDSTHRTDLLVKARLYARAGILEFWVLDLTARQLHIHRTPLNGEYTEVTIHTPNDIVSLTIRPDATMKVANLLPPTE